MNFVNIGAHFSTDVLGAGIWEVFTNIQDPHLNLSVTSLQNTVVHSRAPSTVSKYLYSFLRWKRWAKAHKFTVFPVQEREFVLYLQHLGDTVRSKSAVEEAVSATSWVNQLAGFPAVSNSPFVQVVLDGL